MLISDDQFLEGHIPEVNADTLSQVDNASKLDGSQTFGTELSSELDSGSLQDRHQIATEHHYPNSTTKSNPNRSSEEESTSSRYQDLHQEFKGFSDVETAGAAAQLSPAVHGTALDTGKRLQINKVLLAVKIFIISVCVIHINIIVFIRF